MFWRVSGFAQPSPVEAALDRPNCSLEDLLAEDDLIQEVKSLNSRVMEFLTKPESVTGLVRHLVAPPPPDADQQQQLRQPFAACEVLCCEVEGLLTQLLGDESTMDLLFSLLQQTGTLDCVTAGYFARVVGMLLFRRTAEVMAFIQQRRHLLGRLVAHLDTASIAEILVRLVGAEEQTGMYLPPSQVQWLTGTNLMPQLLAVLEPGHPPDAAKHAAEVLAAVARSALSPLARAMAEPTFLQTLLERAFEEGGPSSVQALDVCIALLEPRPLEPHHTQPSSPAGSATGVSMGSGSPSLGSPGGASPGGSSELRRMSEVTARNLQTAAVAGIAERASRLREMLEDSAAPAPLETAFGILSPPLGSARLKAVEMVAALARLGSPEAEHALISAELLPRCMALFVQYPFNNLLHHQVASMLMGALEYGSSKLTAHAFGSAGLLGWLTGAPTEVRPQPRPNDLRAEHRPSLRAGYMGHVTFIANKLMDAAERSLFVSQQLDASKAWADFAAGSLQARNTLENVNKWACGRPAPSELHSGVSDAPDEAGLMDLDPGPAGSLDIAGDGDSSSPTADGAGQRYFADAAGDDEDDPVFRDASDALDALRLTPHVVPASGKAGGGSDSSDEGSEGSNGDGSPPPAPHGGSAADTLSRTLEAEGDAGVLVVTSDEEELLLEDDAVVVGLPKTLPAGAAADGANSADGADGAAAAAPGASGPLPPPPAAQAVLPDTGAESPDGLDPTKPVSAATPPLVPPLAAAAGTGGPAQAAAAPAPAGDSAAAGAAAAAAASGTAASASPGVSGARGTPSSGVGGKGSPRSGSPPTAPVLIPAGSHAAAADGGSNGRHDDENDGDDGSQDAASVGFGHGGGMASAGMLQRSASGAGSGGGSDTGDGDEDVARIRSSPQGQKHDHHQGGGGGGGGYNSPSAQNPHRAPKSAFASWRPTWQAVEDQAAAAAASAAQEFVAAARAASSDSNGRAAGGGIAAAEQPVITEGSGKGDAGGEMAAAAAAPLPGKQTGEVAAAPAAAEAQAQAPASRNGSDDSAAAAPAADGVPAGKSGRTNSGGMARAPDGRPKFAWGALKSQVVDKEADGFARHFREGKDHIKVRGGGAN